MNANVRTRLNAAVREAGGVVAVAELMNEYKRTHEGRIHRTSAYPQLIQGWLSATVGRDRQVPARWVLALEHAIGGVVTRHEMRPDVFNPRPAATAKPRNV